MKFYLSNKTALTLTILTLISSSTIWADDSTDNQNITLDSPTDIQQIINFMTAPSTQQGVSYVGSAGELSGLILPLSYYNTPDYWAKYVCQLSGNDCRVIDVYNNSDYTLVPSVNSPGANLQAERVNVNYGADIYDAATWQIGLALAGSHQLVGPNGKSLFEIANNQNKLLKLSYDGNADKKGMILGINRATTRDEVFLYNGHTISDPQNAFSFRMISRSFISEDPFINNPSYLKEYISAVNLPSIKNNHSPYRKGTITWLDWKPIEGENAWAFLLGPLQAMQIEYQAFPHTQKYIPFDSLAVQNAINVIDAFQAMQSQIGAFYYSTAGSLGNTGSDPIDPYQVSVENNASTLAGLLLLQHVLQQELRYEQNAASQADRIQNILNKLHVMIYGGITSEGGVTEGVLNFLKNNAWDASHGIFLSGGYANKPGSKSFIAFTDNVYPVDVNTWGVSVLGQPLIDSWYGFGTAYRIWENVKSWGSYRGADGELWGVGYSNQDNKSILSGEWTAGAINMTQALITQYEKVAENVDSYNSKERNQAKDFVTTLKKDRDSMLNHFKSLRTDQYSKENEFANSRPANYDALVPMPADKLAYLYASKRYFIPFGWNANPLPSQASTAWALMLDYHFNPFSVSGTYEANALGPLQQAVTATIINQVTDSAISVSYKQMQYGDEWKEASMIENAKSSTVTFPAGTQVISISFTKDKKQWYQACQLTNPSELTTQNPVTIKAIWTNEQGTGACELTTR